MSLCPTHQKWANENTENEKQCRMCLWLESNHNSRITELELENAELRGDIHWIAKRVRISDLLDAEIDTWRKIADKGYAAS